MMVFLVDRIKWPYQEFGLASVYNTGLDAWLIILARCCRMFAYGANSLILAVFFSALEFSDFYIGIFMTLTLVGDVLLSLGLTMVADRVGRRKILFLGSMLMVVSGATFALAENFWILLFAAVIGVISATGSDFGPFRAIEESTLSHLTTPKTRSDVLAWYVTTASLGSAIGTEISGRVVEYLKNREGWTLVQTYHSVWWLYVVMGSLNMLFTFILSSKCEAETPRDVETEASERLLDEDRLREEDEEVEETSRSHPPTQHEKSNKQSIFAQISKETRWVMYKLWFLLIVDSLADGMTPYCKQIYVLKQDISKDTHTPSPFSNFLVSSNPEAIL
jgi:MFS family permease